VTLTRSIANGEPLPNPLPPHVQPQYYGALAITEAVGRSGSSSVAELTIEDPYLSGYAIYEHGSLVRAVFINSLAYFAADAAAGTVRPVTHVNLSGIEGKAKIRRMGICHADDTENITWAGQSFETNDARPSGSLVEHIVDARDGVNVAATEAVLLIFL
jgi:hypothetical protein